MRDVEEGLRVLRGYLDSQRWPSSRVEPGYMVPFNLAMVNASVQEVWGRPLFIVRSLVVAGVRDHPDLYRFVATNQAPMFQLWVNHDGEELIVWLTHIWACDQPTEAEFVWTVEQFVQAVDAFGRQLRASFGGRSPTG